MEPGDDCFLRHRPREGRPPPRGRLRRRCRRDRRVQPQRARVVNRGWTPTSTPTVRPRGPLRRRRRVDRDAAPLRGPQSCVSVARPRAAVRRPARRCAPRSAPSSGGRPRARARRSPASTRPPGGSIRRAISRSWSRASALAEPLRRVHLGTLSARIGYSAGGWGSPSSVHGATSRSSRRSSALFIGLVFVRRRRLSAPRAGVRPSTTSAGFVGFATNSATVLCNRTRRTSRPSRTPAFCASISVADALDVEGQPRHGSRSTRHAAQEGQLEHSKRSSTSPRRRARQPRDANSITIPCPARPASFRNATGPRAGVPAAPAAPAPVPHPQVSVTEERQRRSAAPRSRSARHAGREASHKLSRRIHDEHPASGVRPRR